MVSLPRVAVEKGDDGTSIFQCVLYLTSFSFNYNISFLQGRGCPEFKSLEDIAKDNKLEFCQKTIASLEASGGILQKAPRIVKKTSSIGLTNEIEMVVNPMSTGKATQL